MSSRYAPRDAADVLRLIAEHPLAWVVSGGAGDFQATPLPLLAERDGEGRLASLLGHFGAGNPQAATLAAAPDALILFSGPEGYISPGIVGEPSWAPTWNYVVLRFQVRVEFRPEETDHALTALTTAMEASTGGDWTPARMGERYAALRGRVRPFRAHILSADHTFKLGQDERPEHFATITAGHPNRSLADWMASQSEA